MSFTMLAYLNPSGESNGEVFSMGQFYNILINDQKDCWQRVYQGNKEQEF